MRQATVRFHERLITLVKGMVKAWEDWLSEVKREIEGEKPKGN